MTTAAESARLDYLEDQVALDDEARATPSTMPLTARYRRHMAAVAYRAARAEQIDPEPEVRPCHICRGVRACDFAAHGLVGWSR
jgi:hypothetical protein